MDVTNQIKGFDLIDRLQGELWPKDHDILHETVIKSILKKGKFKKEKGLSEEPLKIA